MIWPWVWGLETPDLKHLGSKPFLLLLEKGKLYWGAHSTTVLEKYLFYEQAHSTLEKKKQECQIENTCEHIKTSSKNSI